MWSCVKDIFVKTSFFSGPTVIRILHGLLKRYWCFDMINNANNEIDDNNFIIKEYKRLAKLGTYRLSQKSGHCWDTDLTNSDV